VYKQGGTTDHQRKIDEEIKKVEESGGTWKREENS